jgi:hypothetical protein
MAQSREKLTAAVVVIEGTYGSSGTMPAVNQATDALLIYENANPDNPDVERINITPLRPTLAPSKDLIGRTKQQFQFIGYMQGPENLTTGLPWRFMRLIRACAVLETVSNNSSILYRPISSTFASVAAQVWPEGWLMTLLGGYGTFSIEADAGQGVKVTVDMQGVLPTASQFQKNQSMPSQTLETNKAVTWKNCPVTITNGAYTVGGGAVAGGFAITGGTALSPVAVCKNFRFNANARIEERKDSGAVNALAGLLINGYEPELTLQIEMDSNPSINFYDDQQNQALHHINCNLINGGAGNTVNFQAFYCQLTQVGRSIVNGLRVFDLTYKLTTPLAATLGTAEDVWQLRFT